MIKIDSGFYFGIGAFETIALKEGKLVLLEKHLERLKKALSFLHIEQDVKEEEIGRFLSTLSVKNGVVKIAVSEKNVDYSFRKNHYTPEMYKMGVSLCMAPYLRNDTSPFVKYKTLNHSENIWAKRYADTRNVGEALFLNTKGEICEGSCSNIFFVKEGKLYTPNKDCGLLPGIFREMLMEMEPVEEIRIGKHHLAEFDECFITNSIMGIMKVNRIEDYLFSKHETTEYMQKKYREFY